MEHEEDILQEFPEITREGKPGVSFLLVQLYTIDNFITNILGKKVKHHKLNIQTDKTEDVQFTFDYFQ